MLKDKTLHGIIIAGSNLSHLADSTLKEYFSYYKKEGFVFSAPTTIPNVLTYLQGEVTGANPIDYMFKEAHSDGDMNNLFRMSTSATDFVGIKMGPKFNEVIEIVFPIDNSPTELISNQLFGSWLREREAAGLGQLVYFNTSCWSHSKAVAELTAVHSKVFTEIPTLTSTYTFVITLQVLSGTSWMPSDGS